MTNARCIDALELRSGSWLDQGERWFDFITQRAVRRGSFTAVTELRRSIEQFVDHWNQHPQSLAWTVTSDSILAKLQRLRKVVSGTEH